MISSRPTTTVTLISKSYVCIYVCMHACTNIYIHICLCIYKHTHTNTVYVYIHTLTYICVYIIYCVYTHTYTYIYLYIHTYIHTYKEKLVFFSHLFFLFYPHKKSKQTKQFIWSGKCLWHNPTSAKTRPRPKGANRNFNRQLH